MDPTNGPACARARAPVADESARPGPEVPAHPRGLPYRIGIDRAATGAIQRPGGAAPVPGEGAQPSRAREGVPAQARVPGRRRARGRATMPEARRRGGSDRRENAPGMNRRRPDTRVRTRCRGQSSLIPGSSVEGLKFKRIEPLSSAAVLGQKADPPPDHPRRKNCGTFDRFFHIKAPAPPIPFSRSAR